MPTTINGIGTHYYGKSNVSVRQAACHSCGRVGDLKTYDTRLWFVVVFVPVIPLGRKTIIDECPACRRHFVTDQHKFAMARQLSLSGAREKFRADPTADTAAAAHVQMVGFHAHDDAREFRKEVLDQFPDDAMLHAHLAAQLDDAGQYDAATPLVQRAYELSPELPEARQGLALRCLVDGKLDEARALLDFLQEPGAGQLYSLGRLDQLATAYQKAGKHAEAVALFEVLLRELPEVAEHHKFREVVQKSERKLSRRESILPKRGWSWRALFDSKSGRFSPGQRWAAYIGVVALLIGLGLIGLNAHRKGHRTVIVRNEFAPGATVTIDGDTTVPSATQAEVVLGEGTHQVKVAGTINDQFDVDLETGWWQRFTHSPTWVINVGGATPIKVEDLHYAVNPQPSGMQLSVGENLLYVPHVDYLFSKGPREMKMSSDTQVITKHQLTLAPEPVEDVFQYALTSGNPEAAFRFAESRLLLNPADSELLTAYYSAAVGGGSGERAKAFLELHLDRRPTVVNWHRMYQELFPAAADRKKLMERYDSLIAAEPNDAGLLYLRGRLEPSSAEAQKFFDRSMAADPQLPWPWAAMGYRAASRADWARARQCYEEAIQRGFSDGVDGYMMAIRLGLGEGAALEREYQEKLQGVPWTESLGPLAMLVTVQCANGHAAQARHAIDDWQLALPAEERRPELIAAFRDAVDLNAGDLESIGGRVRDGTATPSSRLYWMLLTGKSKEAVDDAAVAPLLAGPWDALGASLALRVDGHIALADEWREKACEQLAGMDFDEAWVAEALRSKDAPTIEAFDEFDAQPAEKAIVAAALAAQFPERRTELMALAQKLAVTPGGEQQLVRKAAAAMAGPAAP